MLAEFRAAVTDLLVAAFPDGAIHRSVPEDVAELPCHVVGMPSATPSVEAATVFDLATTVYVIGRRVGTSDEQDELVTLADATYAALGGTKGTKAGAFRISAESLNSRVVSVGGADYGAYTIPTAAAYSTC